MACWLFLFPRAHGTETFGKSFCVVKNFDLFFHVKNAKQDNLFDVE